MELGEEEDRKSRGRVRSNVSETPLLEDSLVMSLALNENSSRGVVEFRTKQGQLLREKMVFWFVGADQVAVQISMEDVQQSQSRVVTDCLLVVSQGRLAGMSEESSEMSRMLQERGEEGQEEIGGIEMNLFFRAGPVMEQGVDDLYGS